MRLFTVKKTSARRYNDIFPFTSNSMDFDTNTNTNKGKCPPTLRLKGQTCHAIGNMML